MRYLSVCSGIEAASVAWEPLGWEPVAFCEFDSFPRSVLAHHYPDVPLMDDLTAWRDWDASLLLDADLLVGGTPCQSFSVAGKRRGMEDDRGNLALQFLELADAIDAIRCAAKRPPCWVVWENVPGVFSDGANAFGAVLGGMVGSDAAIEPPRDRRWSRTGVVSGPARCAAWRCLDAQYFGLAQRRDRIFIVARGGAGSWSAPDVLLPIVARSDWHPAPSRESREGTAGVSAQGVALRGDGFDARQSDVCQYDDRAGPLDTDGSSQAVMSVAQNQRGEVRETTVATQLTAGGGKPGQGYPAVREASAVRRLTPRECERLQGFPDDYTRVPYRGKPAADGPRYKAIGNSMAVPVMRYIGERIQEVAA